MSSYEISKSTADDRYFLNDRDWSIFNKGKSMTLPYDFYCEGLSEPLRGDAGFEWAKVRKAKERDEFEFVEDVPEVCSMLLPSRV